MKIFTLSALLSSTMIYNILNTIDEKSIESLEFLINVCELV